MSCFKTPETKGKVANASVLRQFLSIIGLVLDEYVSSFERIRKSYLFFPSFFQNSSDSCDLSKKANYWKIYIHDRKTPKLKFQKGSKTDKSARSVNVIDHLQFQSRKKLGRRSGVVFDLKKYTTGLDLI